MTAPIPEPDPVRTLEAGPVRTLVDTADGGRITSLTIAGVEVIGGVGAVVVDHGSFVMAPWAGRIRDGNLAVGGAQHALPTDRTHPHAGHGLVMDRPWQVLAQSDDRLLLQCDLDHRWPFRGHVVQELRLSPVHLDQVVEVHAAEGPFPATIGWHPWFRRTLADGSRARLEFHADGMLVRDEAGIPSGEVVGVLPGPWDDCFTGVRWPMVITWGESIRLEISSDVSFAVVYDERPEAFCVEPQSGPPDGPNTSPTLVRPGAPLSATTRWAWG